MVASKSRSKREEIEVKSESFTPPGVAVATSGAGKGGEGRKGGKEGPPGSHGHVTTELKI